jgi:hypothetical protein
VYIGFARANVCKLELVAEIGLKLQQRDVQACLIWTIPEVLVHIPDKMTQVYY